MCIADAMNTLKLLTTNDVGNDDMSTMNILQSNFIDMRLTFLVISCFNIKNVLKITLLLAFHF